MGNELNLLTGIVWSDYIRKFVCGLNGRKIIQIRNGEAFCSNNNRHVRKCVNASSARVTSLTFFSEGIIYAMMIKCKFK